MCGAGDPTADVCGPQLTCQLQVTPADIIAVAGHVTWPYRCPPVCPQAAVRLPARLPAAPGLRQQPVLEHQSAESLGQGGGARRAGSEGAAEGQPAADWLSERRP